MSNPHDLEPSGGDPQSPRRQSRLAAFTANHKALVGLIGFVLATGPTYGSVPVLTRYEVWAAFLILIAGSFVAEFWHGRAATASIVGGGVLALGAVVVIFGTHSTPDPSSGADPRHPPPPKPGLVASPLDSNPLLEVRAFDYWFVLDATSAAIFRFGDDGRLSAELDHLSGPAHDMVACGSKLYVSHADGLVARVDPLSGKVVDYHYARGVSGPDLASLACGGNVLWVVDPAGHRVFDLTLGLHYLRGVTLDDMTFTAIAAGRGALWIVDASANELIGIEPGKALRKLGPYAVDPGVTEIRYRRPYLWLLHVGQACVRRFDFGRDAELDSGTPTGPNPGAMSVEDGQITVTDIIDGAILTIDSVTGELVGNPIVLGAGSLRLTAASEFDGRVLAIDAANDRAVFLSRAAAAARRHRLRLPLANACR